MSPPLDSWISTLYLTSSVLKGGRLPCYWRILYITLSDIVKAFTIVCDRSVDCVGAGKNEAETNSASASTEYQMTKLRRRMHMMSSIMSDLEGQVKSQILELTHLTSRLTLWC